jgi:hypothetical protein
MVGIKKKYDHIVSLGYNCEISFQFSRYFDFLSSNLFAWSYIPNTDCLLNCIKNPANILAGEITGPYPLYECENTKVRFHGRSLNVIDFNGNINEQIRKDDISELKSRINYLKSKFQKILDHDGSVLYIMKLKSPEQDENNWLESNINFVKELNNVLLEKRNGKNFDLLIIIESKYYNENWNLLNNENIYIRTVNNYTPETNVGDEKVSDLNGWRKIFIEFSPNNKPGNAVLRSFFDFRTAKRSISLYLFKLFLPNIIRVKMRIIGYKIDFCFGQIKD